jgi:hypothetical protein
MIMRSILHLPKLLLLIISVLTAASCTQETLPESTDSTVNEDYQSYSKDGLSLQYPKHWSFLNDNEPAIFADREISFNPTEFSMVNVSIYKQDNAYVTKASDYFEQTSKKIKSRKYVVDFQEIPIEIAGFKGLRLRWIDSKLTPFYIERSILVIKDSPTLVLASFYLTAEDIVNETIHIAPFIKSISLQ